MAASYKWSDVWAAIEHMPPQTQNELYSQLDLRVWLAGKSAEVQIEVLRCAPTMIVESLSDILKTKAKEKL
uniref:Uncharacterized protein n=1 Tax=viral metagenome TaxID=1070528 RepID=A0A6H1ZB38_9ZZZZ